MFYLSARAHSALPENTEKASAKWRKVLGRNVQNRLLGKSWPLPVFGQNVLLQLTFEVPDLFTYLLKASPKRVSITVKCLFSALYCDYMNEWKNSRNFSKVADFTVPKQCELFCYCNSFGNEYRLESLSFIKIQHMFRSQAKILKIQRSYFRFFMDFSTTFGAIAVTVFTH